MSTHRYFEYVTISFNENQPAIGFISIHICREVLYFPRHFQNLSPQMTALPKIQPTSTSDKIRNRLLLNLAQKTLSLPELGISSFGRPLGKRNIGLSVTQNAQLILVHYLQPVCQICSSVTIICHTHVILISPIIIPKIFYGFVLIEFTISDLYLSSQIWGKIKLKHHSPIGPISLEIVRLVQGTD